MKAIDIKKRIEDILCYSQIDQSDYARILELLKVYDVLIMEEFYCQETNVERLNDFPSMSSPDTISTKNEIHSPQTTREGEGISSRNAPFDSVSSSGDTHFQMKDLIDKDYNQEVRKDWNRKNKQRKKEEKDVKTNLSEEVKNG